MTIYYAVARGRNIGVFDNWPDAKRQVEGYFGARFKRFMSSDDAMAFIEENKIKEIGHTVTSFFERSVPARTPTEPCETETTLICFTDGSTFKNGHRDAKGGYAVVWPFHEDMNDYGPVPNATNNRSEYVAVIQAFKIANIIDPSRSKTLVIFTDSMLIINSMTKWLPGWRRNNYRKADGEPVANLELLKELESHMNKRACRFKHVRAHTGLDTWEAKHNEKADMLAKQGHRK